MYFFRLFASKNNNLTSESQVVSHRSSKFSLLLVWTSSPAAKRFLQCLMLCITYLPISCVFPMTFSQWIHNSCIVYDFHRRLIISLLYMDCHTQGLQPDTQIYCCKGCSGNNIQGAVMSGRDKWLHPTVVCGMQLLIYASDTCSWCQSPHIWALAQYYGNSSALASKHAVYSLVQDCSNSNIWCISCQWPSTTMQLPQSCTKLTISSFDH